MRFRLPFHDSAVIKIGSGIPPSTNVGRIFSERDHCRAHIVVRNRLNALKGILKTRNHVRTARSESTNQRAYAKLGPKIYAEARYLKILRWKSWKERPLTQAL